MIIEIHGGGFKNKGAELMLVSILDVFSKHHPEVKFCINPSIYDDSASCKKYGIYEYIKTPKARGGRLFSARFLLNRSISKFIPASYLNSHNLVKFDQVDALLDISGVRFSDKASTVAGKNFLELARYFRKKGKPVILLPQMFGPFNKSQSVTLMRQITKESSLIFARDAISLDLIKQSVPEATNVFRAPDITIPISSGLLDLELHKKNERYGCLVPNARMYDRGDDGWSEKYVNLLALAALELHAKGIKPFLLVHSLDGDEDKPIAEKVQQIVGHNICSIKLAEDPLDTKDFISRSTLLIGSRYHSIVSALSSGVPVIVMGWAHKYETILSDFGMAKYLHTVNDDTEHFKHLINSILNIENNKNLKDILQKNKESMVIESEEMWNNVFECLML